MIGFYHVFYGLSLGNRQSFIYIYALPAHLLKQMLQTFWKKKEWFTCNVKKRSSSASIVPDDWTGNWSERKLLLEPWKIYNYCLMLIIWYRNIFHAKWMPLTITSQETSINIESYTTWIMYFTSNGKLCIVKSNKKTNTDKFTSY